MTGRETRPDSGPRPPTIRDVAAAAGVTYQTVSRVINGDPHVKDSTRERVLATITSLRFRPNRSARALAGGPVQSVTVITPDTRLYGPREVLAGVEHTARAAGLTVAVEVVESAPLFAPGELSGAIARAARPGNAIIVWDENRATVPVPVPAGIPMAAIVEAPPGNEANGKPWLWIDDRQAAFTATRYLLSLGHPTVHYLAIPPWTNTRPRQDGWRAALQQAGAPIPSPIHRPPPPQRLPPPPRPPNRRSARRRDALSPAFRQRVSG